MAADDAFGYARIATLKKNLEAQGAEVLLFDAGDFSQGTPIVNLGYGKNAVEFMNAAGYDLATLGNHEFDWGTDNLLQILENAQFPIVCANLTRTADDTLVFPACITFDTVIGKVGVFGLDTPETMTKAHPDKVKGVTFAQAEELYAVAQAEVDELTAAGCDLIVCLGHLGDADESLTNRSIDVVANTTGIDLFIDGHSHSVLDGNDPENQVNGAMLDTEAIADLTGVKCMLRIAAGEDNFDYDRFFRALAANWRTLTTLETEAYAIEQDVHPLPYLRTNAVVVQFEEFHRTYGTKEGDGMYLAPEYRLEIW